MFKTLAIQSVPSLLALALLASSADRRQATAAPPDARVAVIDVQEVLNSFSRFKIMMAELKADATRADQQLKAAAAEVKEMARGLNDLLPGTRDYLDLQGKIKERGEELKAQVQLQKSELMQREARAYRDAYREIVQEIEAHAKKHGIEVVLRTNAPVKTETPAEILRDINKQVVWFAPSRDITAAILDRLNAKGSESKPETKPAEKKPAEEEPKPEKKPDAKPEKKTAKPKPEKKDTKAAKK